jgi:S-layer protein
LGSDNATINGGKNISATVAVGTSGTVDIGATTAPAGTVSYTGAYTQANGNTHGAVTVTGGTTQTVTLSTGNAVNTTNTFGAVTATGGASTTTVSVTQDAAATAAVAVKGVVNGAVSVLDANRASTTKAGSITDVTVSSGAAVTINSGALENIFASGKMTTLNAGTLGALTTAAINDIHLHTNGLTTTGAVTFDTDVKTITINSHTAASTIASLVDASATTLNVIGDAKLTVSAHTLAATASISTADSTGGATFTGALGNTVSFAGGAGADTVSLGATTKAITTGAGADQVTVGVSALGYLGSIDAGDGIDTLVMSAANAATASATATFGGTISGFEVLALGAATADATIALAKLDSMNTVSTAGVANGDTVTITGASSGFTLVANAGVAGTVVASMTDATGTADVANVSVTATAAKTIAALTLTGFEVLNFDTQDSQTTASGLQHIVTALTDADATTINVAGDAGLSLGFTGTKVTSFDASGVTKGAVTWTSGALAAAATVKGGAGANTVDLSASSKAMTYTGGAVVDTITTGAGAGTIVAGAGNDVIVAGNGANTVHGDAGNDNITTGTGADTIEGGAGNDTIAAGNGANTINGGDGNDGITGGSGVDTVDGGAGTDTFTMDNTEQAGSGSVDGSVINLSDAALTQSAVFTLTGKYLTTVNASVAAGTATYLYSNESSTNADVVDTLASIENVVGAGELDYIVGSASANTITGGAGNDVMTGGAAVDTFVRNGDGTTDGADTITDFTVGNGGDVIDLTTNGATVNSVAVTGYEAGSGAVTYNAATGIFVYTGNDLAAATEAGVEDLFDTTTATLAFNAANAAGDISYLVASDGTNTYVFHLVDTDGDDTFTAAGDVGTLALTLTGVTDASKFVAANFADFS